MNDESRETVGCFRSKLSFPKGGEKIPLGYGATYPVVGRGLEQYEVATITAVGKPGTQAYLAVDAPAGATNIKVTSVSDISVGQKIMIDTRANLEHTVIATVGTAGGATLSTGTEEGMTVAPVGGAIGFRDGETITIDSGSNSERAVIASVRRFGTPRISVTAPLVHPHAAGAQVSGTGITLTPALVRPHAIGAQVTDNVPTPGAPNRYQRKRK